MCGISLSEERLNSLEHRGPDEHCMKTIKLHDDNVILEIFRLIINDPVNGAQPFCKDKAYLLCNGEIYNTAILRQQINGKFRSKSDCEVILHLYLKNRNDESFIEAVKKLDGEFAIILVDVITNTIYSARDPFGIRPLFISFSPNGFPNYASEIKAFKMLTDVVPLLPGNVCISRKKQNWCHTIKHFYEIPNSEIDLERDFAEKYLSRLLRKAVQKRLYGGRQIGCLLSGGLDSSIITTIANDSYPYNLPCFSIGLKDSADVKAAKYLADFISNFNHHVVEFTVEEGISHLEEVIKTLETYDITTVRASIPQYILAKYIQENTDIRVVLSGEGADELFCGYFYSKLEPHTKSLIDDSKRLLEELFMFDVLRTDRTMAAFGIEVRVPFLDRDVVDFVFSINPEYRRSSIEKKFLRDSFADTLPYEILWRPKAAFSDAVSSPSETWYHALVNYSNDKISDELFDSRHVLYPYNTPPTKEAFLYRQIFEKYYPNRSKILTHYWMPKWVDSKGDPSATILSIAENKSSSDPVF